MNNIIPGYRIRLLTKAEKAKKVGARYFMNNQLLQKFIDYEIGDNFQVFCFANDFDKDGEFQN